MAVIPPVSSASFLRAGSLEVGCLHSSSESAGRYLGCPLEQKLLLFMLGNNIGVKYVFFCQA